MSKTENVWIISEQYFPCENTTSYIITKITEGLTDQFKVNVITAASTGYQSEQVNRVNIHYVKNPDLDKNKFLERTIKLILIGIRLFIKSAKLIRKNDTVLVVTNPAPIVFLMGFLRFFKKFRLFFLVHDVFPENLVIARVVQKNNPFYRITLRVFNWSYRKAEKLIVIGRDMGEFMKRKLNKSCPPIWFIPNFADINEIYPQCRSENELSKKFRLDKKFVILFTGNIGRAQDIENILETMKILEDNDKIHLLMIGQGAKFSNVERFIGKNKLRNITLLPAMSRNHSNLFLNAGDVGLVSLQKGRKGIGIPSKTYSYLAAGKPILGVVDPGSEVEMVIKETNCGWWTNPGNPDDLARLITWISNSGNEISKKSQIARELAVNKYAIEKVVPKFKYLFNEQEY